MTNHLKSMLCGIKRIASEIYIDYSDSTISLLKSPYFVG